MLNCGGIIMTTRRQNSPMNDVEKRLPNWKATWELVKTVAREDFGVEAVEYKELLEIINNLSEAFKRFRENPLQGAMNHGREMDSSRYRLEGRRIALKTSCKKRGNLFPPKT